MVVLVARRIGYPYLSPQFLRTHEKRQLFASIIWYVASTLFLPWVGQSYWLYDYVFNPILNEKIPSPSGRTKNVNHFALFPHFNDNSNFETGHMKERVGKGGDTEMPDTKR